MDEQDSKENTVSEKIPENSKPEEKVDGRKVTKEDMDMMLKVLRPYLQQGLTLRKACTQAGVPKSTVFDWNAKYEYFSDKITEYQDFISVIVNNAVLNEVHAIIQKQNAIETLREQKKDKPLELLKLKGLTRDEKGYLQWFVTTARATKEEYSPRKDIELIDSEAELQRVREKIDKAFEDDVEKEEKPKEKE